MVLWEYTELFFITALSFTFLAFHSSVNRIGKAFYLIAGGMCWGIIGWTLEQIDFIWSGSINIITYTYVPAGFEAWLPSAFGWIGVLMILLGAILGFTGPLAILWKWLSGGRGDMGDIWGEK